MLPSWLTVTTALLDGSACRTRAGFFGEAARVLRLPGYFGHNWDALTDVLRDGGPSAVVVRDAEQLLADEPPAQLATLLAVAAERGLALTLLTDPAHEERLRARLAAALAR